MIKKLTSRLQSYLSQGRRCVLACIYSRKVIIQLDSPLQFRNITSQIQMLKQIIRYTLLILFLVVVALYILFSPQYARQLHYQEHIVRIERDQYGIPHIHAPNRRSFLYAWGNVMAEDRLFQCTFRNIYAQGRLSEFLGERTLNADIMMRDLGFPRIAEAIVQRMQKEDTVAYGDFTAFVEGVNDNVGGRLVLPIEFYVLGIKWQNWTVATPYTLQKVLQWTISHNMKEEYARSFLLSQVTSLDELEQIMPTTKQSWAFESQTTIKDQDIPQRLKNTNYRATAKLDPIQVDKILNLGAPEIFISAEGSNAWAVSGEHTQSGRPILVADPHLDSALPSHWYQMRASYVQNGKEVEFAGVSVPGVPLAYGKTKYLATAMTVIFTDTQDLYQEKVEGNKYLVDGQWRDLKIRNETILIKTEQGLKEHSHQVRLTHRGPILNFIVSQFGTYSLDQPLSLSWTGYNDDFASLVACSRHLEIDNFQDAMSGVFKNGTAYFLSLSMLAITADDHIIYHQSGVNPIRSNLQAGSFVKDGTSSANDWLGFMSPEDRLTVADPKSGFIVTANNRPASSLFQGGYFNHTIFTARADRLEEIVKGQIASGRKITNQFAKNTLYDTVDVYCRQILPQILQVLSEAKSTLNDFNCNMSSTSFQAAMYEVFMVELWGLMALLPKHDFSAVSLHNPQQSLYTYIHQAYKGDISKQDFMKEAWKAMKGKLQDHFKSEDHTQWLWGQIHRDVINQLPLGAHPLLSKLYKRQTAGWGNMHTPNVAKCNRIEQGNYATSHRANFRSVYDFGGPSWWTLDGGASENFLSHHYDDQWHYLISNRLIPIDLPSQTNNTSASEL